MADLTIDTKQIEAKTGDAVAQAERLEVTTDQQYETVASFLKGLKAIRNEIARTFDPIARKLHAAHKEVVAQKKRHSAPVEQAERIVKGKIGVYLTEKERLRRQEEEKLRELARKQEEERRLAEAEALEKEGKNEEAEAIIDEPVETLAVVIEDTTPKVEGISKTRKAYKFRIVDEAKIPREFLRPDEVKIGQIVRATKGTLQIPGVEIFSEDVIAVKV